MREGGAYLLHRYTRIIYPSLQFAELKGAWWC